MGLEVTILKSVGSVITSDGTVYPLKVDNTPDIQMGCHIEDIENDEWFETLDDEDNFTLLKLGFAEEF